MEREVEVKRGSAISRVPPPPAPFGDKYRGVIQGSASLRCNVGDRYDNQKGGRNISKIDNGLSREGTAGHR